MAQQSKIQWTDATWNIARGCTKVDADCKFCYMYRQSLNSTRYVPNQVIRTKTVFNLPLKLEYPSKIFTSSLTDFFHEDIDSYRDEAWEIIRKCPQHTFQILTKRPERINQCLPEDWGQGWDNVWLGTSVGSQKAADVRVPLLLKVPAKIRFLSIEPLHAEVNLTHMDVELAGDKEWCFINCLSGKHDDMARPCPPVPTVDWVIVGGESGNENGKYKYRPCNIEWIERIVTDCQKNDTAVFVKQLGTHLSKAMKLNDRHGGDIEEFPDHLKVRQFPELGIKNIEDKKIKTYTLN